MEDFFHFRDEDGVLFGLPYLNMSISSDLLNDDESFASGTNSIHASLNSGDPLTSASFRTDTTLPSVIF